MRTAEEIEARILSKMSDGKPLPIFDGEIEELKWVLGEPNKKDKKVWDTPEHPLPIFKVNIVPSRFVELLVGVGLLIKASSKEEAIKEISIPVKYVAKELTQDEADAHNKMGRVMEIIKENEKDRGG